MAGGGARTNEPAARKDFSTTAIVSIDFIFDIIFGFEINFSMRTFFKGHFLPSLSQIGQVPVFKEIYLRGRSSAVSIRWWK